MKIECIEYVYHTYISDLAGFRGHSVQTICGRLATTFNQVRMLHQYMPYHVFYYYKRKCLGQHS